MAALDKRSTGVGRKPALFVVDASVGFTDSNCAFGSSFDSEVTAIGRLLERFRELGLPIYSTTIAYANPDQAHVWRAKLPGLNLLEGRS